MYSIAFFNLHYKDLRIGAIYCIYIQSNFGISLNNVHCVYTYRFFIDVGFIINAHLNNLHIKITKEFGKVSYLVIMIFSIMQSQKLVV